MKPTINLRLDIFSHATDFSVRPLSPSIFCPSRVWPWRCVMACPTVNWLWPSLCWWTWLEESPCWWGSSLHWRSKGRTSETYWSTLVWNHWCIVGYQWSGIGGFWPEPSSSGALLVLASLAGWVLWYSGNIEGLTSRKELGHIGSAVDRLARNLSRKMRTYRGQYWSNGRTSWFFTFVSINRSYFPAFQKRQTTFWQVLFLYIRSCWISVSFFTNKNKFIKCVFFGFHKQNTRTMIILK